MYKSLLQKIGLPFVLFAVTGVVFSSSDEPSNVLYGDAIVAIVDNVPITGYALMQEVTISGKLDMLKNVPANEQEKYKKMLQDQILTKMIERKVLYKEFEELKAKVPVQMIQEKLDKMVLMKANGNMERFEKILYENNMTVTEIKKKIIEDLASSMLLYDRVQRDIQVSEPEIQDYYKAHESDFNRVSQYRLEVILLKKEGRFAGKLPATWEKIRKGLQSGKSFSALAKEYSEDASAQNGGDMGWQKDLNEKIMAVVKSLEKGGVTEKPLVLGQGEYLLRMADKINGGIVKLDDGPVRENISQYLRNKKEEKRYAEFMEPLLKKYDVKRMNAY